MYSEWQDIESFLRSPAPPADKLCQCLPLAQGIIGTVSYHTRFNTNDQAQPCTFPRCTAFTIVMSYNLYQSPNSPLSFSKVLSYWMHMLISSSYRRAWDMSNDESDTLGRRSYFCPAPTSIQLPPPPLCSI